MGDMEKRTGIALFVASAIICSLLFVNPAFSATNISIKNTRKTQDTKKTKDVPKPSAVSAPKPVTVSAPEPVTVDAPKVSIPDIPKTSPESSGSATLAAPAEPGYSGSELGQPPAEEMVITPKGEVREVPAQIVPVLKKIDINRIGTAPSYETFIGQRMANYFPAKYFTVAQRVEIFQEPRPIDAYAMDAKKIRWLHFNQPWNNPADYRSQIKPIFTRAYGTEVTMSDPRWPEAMIRYTLDYRDIYQNQFQIYRYNPVPNFNVPPGNRDIQETRNVNYKHEQWDQNDILWMYARQIPGINWYFSANFGYRYSTMNAKNDGVNNSYYENRHTYYSYFSIAPSDRCEWFGQFEYFKSKRPRSRFTYDPDHYFYAAELRMKSRDKKTSVIPRFSYSIDYYHPFRNTFEKYEMQIRIGHDFTPKLNATTAFKCNLSIRNEIDNQAPFYTFDRSALRLTSGPGCNPIHDMAGWVGVENRAQYNFYDRLWIQGGLDLAAGTNMNDFDNMGFLTGLEYYAPGLIRVDVGYRGNYYYNVQDYLTSIYFKVYFFM